MSRARLTEGRARRCRCSVPMIGDMTADADRPADAARPLQADLPAEADRPAGAAQDPRALTRAHFDHVVPATTRWSDNDMYGHLNNAVYYELFDSAINGWLITGAGVDVMALPELGVVAESRLPLLPRAGVPPPARRRRPRRTARAQQHHLRAGTLRRRGGRARRARPLGPRLHRPHLPLHGADPPLGPRAPRARRAGPSVRTTGAFPQTGNQAVVSARPRAVPRPGAATGRT